MAVSPSTSADPGLSSQSPNCPVLPGTGLFRGTIRADDPFHDHGARRAGPFQTTGNWRSAMGRGILLWLLGIPIPLIILIMLFWR